MKETLDTRLRQIGVGLTTDWRLFLLIVNIRGHLYINIIYMCKILFYTTGKCR